MYAGTPNVRGWGFNTHLGRGDAERKFVTSSSSFPDYLNDLNACYSMEAMLNPDEEEEFLTFLGAYNHDSEATWNACHATATERCEAFLRVKNLWKD
jgi:hypothetical protein